MTNGEGARIAVLGAGPCGLATAVAAARAGHDVVLFEAAGRVGGMAGSIEVAGQRVDLGSHRLHPVASPPVESLLREALGPDLQDRRRRGRIHLEGRWLDFPLAPGDMVTHLPPSFLAGAVRDLVASPWRTPADGTDAHTPLVARLGPTVAERFYRPYLTKLYGTDPTNLHAEVADRRVAARRAGDIVAKALRARPATDFRYPRTGFGQLSEALADLAAAAGATVSLDTPVTGLSIDDDGVSIDTPGGAVTVDAVVSTLPAALLARLAGAPRVVDKAVSSLRHRGLHLVHLDLDAPRLSAADALYFPGAETPVARISEPRNFRDNPADPVDHTVVCAEVPYDPEDPVPDDDALGVVVVDTLARAGVSVPAVRSVQVTSLSRVYPVYTAASRRALGLLEEWVATLPRLLSVGRQGLFTPDNTHHVLAMGLDAAAVVGPDGVDREAWDRRRAVYRDFVVED